MKPIPNKYDVLHGLLYLAPVIFGIIAAKWPPWWPACIAALGFAHYVAINTHKPGAEKVIAELEQDAKNVRTVDAPVSVVVDTKGSEP